MLKPNPYVLDQGIFIDREDNRVRQYDAKMSWEDLYKVPKITRDIHGQIFSLSETNGPKAVPIDAVQKRESYDDRLDECTRSFLEGPKNIKDIIKARLQQIRDNKTQIDIRNTFIDEADLEQPLQFFKFADYNVGGVDIAGAPSNIRMSQIAGHMRRQGFLTLLLFRILKSLNTVLEEQELAFEFVQNEETMKVGIGLTYRPEGFLVSLGVNKIGEKLEVTM